MTTLATTLAPSLPAAPGIDRSVTLLALLAIAATTAATTLAIDARQGLLVLIGAALGITLYHASFGFTGGWRAFITERRADGIRAQMLTIAIAAVLILPLLSLQQIGGQQLTGAFGPLGVSLLAGAFLFGFGMQLGGGCGSGTLFTVGGGNLRMLVTLLFFIIGAVIGTAHLPWWAALPQIGVVRLPDLVGLWPAILLNLAGLGAVAAIATLLERRRHPAGRHPVAPATASTAVQPLGQRLLRGPWPLLWGAVLLALLNALTLIAAGHPWSITFAFNLWGAKALAAFGVPVAAWEFWTWPMPAQALNGSILADTTSVMDFGLILGALLAAGLAGKFAPDWRIPPRSLAAAVIGGLLMGYGARLGFGCNIGAFFSGIASGSLHGWVWFAAAFAGSILGVRLRPAFGLGR
ncbi:MAG: YeeE/YedE family protein [Ferrovibrio sp.]|nr:YeeE/YedE family protein [Ferrovibrio sp.]